MDVRTTSLELLGATFPEGIDLLLASPPILANHFPVTHRERTPMGPDVVRHIFRLILHLSEAQPEGVGYLWNSSELNPASANTLSLLGQGTVIDASKCGSGAYRNTRFWQNLLPHDALVAEHARLMPPIRPVDAVLEKARLTRWSLLPTPNTRDHLQIHRTPPKESFPYLGTHQDTAPSWIH